MKAAEDAGEEYCDPEREDNIMGRNETRLALWKEQLKDPIVGLDKALKCVESSCWKVVARVLCGGCVLQWLLLASSKVCGRSRFGRAFGPTWIRWILCLRTASVEWNVPGKYGPHGELFFFLIQKEPATMPDIETFSPFFSADIRTPFFSADVLKKCALVGMHLIAEEERGGKGVGQTLDLGDVWRNAQRVQCGRVKAKLGRKTKVLALVKAM